MPSAASRGAGGAKETNPLLKDLPKDTAKTWEIDIVECLEKLKVELFDDDDNEEGIRLREVSIHSQFPD
ncbi:hypothetical protein FOZ63_018729 [Perkinsus olseni]|uniref:Uncharacterized protein n=1 Tax=Perkinsus olseni TaxID=32597 RepID=A0A7J6TV88_PEROL|nr:hypothetical protein FOZ63_018729 [Perkinsus olseni]